MELLHQAAVLFGVTNKYCEVGVTDGLSQSLFSALQDEVELVGICDILLEIGVEAEEEVVLFVPPCLEDDAVELFGCSELPFQAPGMPGQS